MWRCSSMTAMRAPCIGRRSQQTPESESRNQPAQKAVSAAVEVLPSADTVASASTLAEVQMLPLADVCPSSRIRFVEPVTDVLHRDAHVESLGDGHEHDDRALLLTVGEEEPYRPSPVSPSPAPGSEEEPDVQLDIPPRVLADEEAVSVRVGPGIPSGLNEKGRFADNGAAALAV
jgi:hypothetical protein